jgi:transcription antitermination protein NusB
LNFEIFGGFDMNGLNSDNVFVNSVSSQEPISSVEAVDFSTTDGVVPDFNQGCECCDCSEQSDQVDLSATTRRKERILAFNLVYAIDRFDYSVDSNEVLQYFTAGFGVSLPKDSFVLKVVDGSTVDRDSIDDLIIPFLQHWKLNRLGCCTKLILRMAIWELIQQDAIKSVAINEAVELAKTFAEKDAYKFVNGILDEFCKDREKGVVIEV